MNRNRLLIGISAAALAAGTAAVPAAAQTNNTSTGNCTATNPISGGGTCDVDNNVSGNDNNRASVTQVGEGNFARITQRGDDNVGAVEQNGEDNDSRIRQDGDDHFAFSRQVGILNESTIRQGDDQNSASVLQTGEGNGSFLVQGTEGDTAGAPNSNQGEDNVASVNQNGNDLTSTVRQRRYNEAGTGNGFDGPADDNSATVTQTGAGSDSAINQLSRGNIARVRLGEGGVDTPGTPASGTTPATNPVIRANTSVVTQYNQYYRTNPATGGLRAETRNGPNVPDTATTDPSATTDPTIPGPSPTNNPRSDNLADVAIIGVGNSSELIQNGVLNRATVSMLGGGSGNTGSTSTGTCTTNPENCGPSGMNSMRLRENAKAGNDSAIFQVGRGNQIDVSLGGLGGQGNRSTVQQGAQFSNHAGYVEGQLARDHRALVWQRGILDTLRIVQDNNLHGPGDDPANAGFGSTLPGNGAAQGASYADVSQRSLNSTVYLEQEGTNSATVSQGVGTSTGDNSVRILQLDAGDTPNTTGGGIFDDPATSFTVARNTVAVSQSGLDNGITVDQDAVNATAIAWQQNGSRQNRIEIEQGTGGQSDNANRGFDQQTVGSQGGFLAQNTTDAPTGSTVATVDSGDYARNAITLTADVTQSGRGSRARVRQDGQNLSVLVNQAGTLTNTQGVAINSNNFVGVSQINAYNSATVTQSGSNNSATVDQRGSGGVGTDNVLRRNLVSVQQTGDSNRALARQTVDVGPSGPNNTANTAAPAAGDASQPTVFLFTRPAGRNSAEIQIIQSGSPNLNNQTAAGGTLDDLGNDAFVEQNGRGQFARIVQNGAGNDAGIRQNANATNAVAVIEQNGNGNSFFITQDFAGQYMHIRQNGNGNAVTTEVSSAPVTGQVGGTGTTNPATFGSYPF